MSAKTNINAVINSKNYARLHTEIPTLPAHEAMLITKYEGEIKSWVTMIKIISADTVRRLKKQYTISVPRKRKTTKETTVNTTPTTTQPETKEKAVEKKPDIIMVRTRDLTIPFTAVGIWGDEVPGMILSVMKNEGIDTNARPGYFPGDRWNAFIAKLDSDEFKAAAQKIIDRRIKAAQAAFIEKMNNEFSKPSLDAAKQLKEEATAMNLRFDRRLVLLAWITGMGSEKIMDAKWHPICIFWKGDHIEVTVDNRAYNQNKDFWKKVMKKMAKRCEGFKMNVNLTNKGWLIIS